MDFKTSNGWKRMDEMRPQVRPTTKEERGERDEDGEEEDGGDDGGGEGDLEVSSLWLLFVAVVR